MSSRFNPILPGVLALIVAGHAQASMEQAVQALAEGNYPRARVELEQVDGGDRESARWQLLDAAALAGSGELAAAESRYQRLISRFPDTPEAYNNLAVLYARQGRFDEARELLEQAMQTSDSYATVYENLSNIYFEMSRSSYAKALQMEQDKRSASLEPLYVIDKAEPIRVAAGESGIATVDRGVQQPTVVAQAPLPPAMPEPEPEPVAGAVEPEQEPQSQVLEEATVEDEETVVAAAPVAAAPETASPTVVEQPVVEDEAVTPPAVAEKPVAAEPGSEEVPAAAPPAETVSPRERLVATLNSWATAWAGQDVEGYLGAYDKTFDPGRGLSFEQWQEQRRRRLARPDFIEVELSDFEVVLQGGERARVTLIQRYRSNTYSDKTRKRFRLLRRPEGWKIVSEKTIEVL